MKQTVFTAALALISSALMLAQAPAQPQAQPTATPDQIAARQRAQQEQLANDWPNLARYRDANQALPPVSPGAPRVVFMGDSITELWDRDSGQFFAKKGYIGRGIGGQTTPQMLIRFQQDVVSLKPGVVVINAGTNDIAGNTGPSTLEMIEDNLKSMAQLATANGIRVVLASVTPAYDYPWKRGLEPAEKVVALNSWIKDYCAKTGCVYADYFTSMSDEKHGMKEGLSRDGIHPTPAGYAIMAPIAEKAIAQALGK
ncbi:MAG TPA: SGNH/GDSL hydrolase family protein [Bryobacteraceae bacterium]|nr:SGNH/GDSL hydrolase family protein [Bryobacteraceae bacterium]